MIARPHSGVRGTPAVNAGCYPWAQFRRRLGTHPRSVAALGRATLAALTTERVIHRVPWAQRGTFLLPPPSWFINFLFDADVLRYPIRSGVS